MDRDNIIKRKVECRDKEEVVKDRRKRRKGKNSAAEQNKKNFSFLLFV